MESSVAIESREAENSIHNPYTPPTVDLSDETKTINQQSAERLLAIAKAQKGILLLILLSFASVGLLAVQNEAPAVVGVIMAVFRLGVVVATAVFLFRMARLVYNLGIAIFFVVLSVVPLVNLIALVAANQRATKALQQQGFRVGLLGADIARVKAWADNQA